MRLLGLDYGDVYIGVAISDDKPRLAVAKDILQGQTRQQIQQYLQTVIAEEGITTIVVGMPLGLAGKPTQQTKKTEKFVQWLRGAVSVAVEIMDERLTTGAFAAEHGGNRRPQRDDAQAARILLQNYIDRHYDNQG